MATYKVTIVIGLASFWLIAVAGADDKIVGSIGLLGGVASLNNGGGNQFIYSLEGDYFLNPNLSLGFTSDTVNPSPVSVGGASYTQTLSNLDLTIKFNWKQLSLGVLAGVGTTITKVPGAPNSSNFNYGSTVGYDYSLSSNFSVGPQLTVVWTTLNYGYTETDFLITVKYWLLK